MSDALTVAVHQPNFFPWLGYFAKILAADRFVCLDDAQLKNSGGSWSNRVKLIVGGKPQWITAAIDRSRPGLHAICDSDFADTDWREKARRSIELNYRKSTHFDDTMALLEPLLMSQTSNIADYNLTATVAICEALRIDTPIVRSSELAVHSAATERLIALVKRAGGTAYLSGDGAGGYQDDEMFSREGIGLAKLGFAHPVYPQRDGTPAEFEAGLSIIDLLMNVGPENARERLDESLAKSGLRGAQAFGS